MLPGERASVNDNTGKEDTKIKETCSVYEKAAGHIAVQASVVHPEKEFSKYLEIKRQEMLILAFRITKCWASAEDVVQDATIKLHQLLITRGFEGMNVGGWLHTVTKRCALQYIRSRDAHKMYPLNDAINVAVVVYDSPLEREEEIDAAKRFARRLPSQQRKVLEMRELEGWKFDRIGRELHISAATARSYYSKALKRVQRLR